jgi:hypothetical protein
MAYFAQGLYSLTVHGFQEMRHDHITVATLEYALGRDAPELLEDYPDRDVGPCCLVLAWSRNNVALHAVVGYGGDYPDIVTVYSPPDLKIWESDFRTRRS